ncbi:hypothetical protein D9M68_931700 [compost metagenome]
MLICEPLPVPPIANTPLTFVACMANPAVHAVPSTFALILPSVCLATSPSLFLQAPIVNKIRQPNNNLLKFFIALGFVFYKTKKPKYDR